MTHIAVLSRMRASKVADVASIARALRGAEERDTEHRFRALVECSSDAIFITDFDSARFVEVNSRASELFGYTAQELRGMTGRQLHASEDSADVDGISAELIQSGSVERPAVRMQRKDGTLFWAELRSHTYRAHERKLYVTFVRDISARMSREEEIGEAYRALKEKESQLIRSSRLAAIGQLAAGIGHEISNPAASVLVNLELLKEDLAGLSGTFQQAQRSGWTDRELHSAASTLSDTRDSVKDSLEAIARIVAMVRGLRGFTRIDEDDVTPVDMNDVVLAACALVRHQIRHSASVSTELTAQHQFPGERGKLVQVVVNLLINASHAIEDGGGTSIRVTTRSTDDAVVLQIEDDGPGVPAMLAERIFEPFFTTKSTDRGTGLGLSLCADIVHQHRGTLRLRNRGAAGACFEVFVPLETGLKVAAPRTGRQPEVQSRRILVVDDDVALLRAYRRYLGRRHDVVVAYSGEEALAVLARDENFDLILCDLMMPGVDGVGVYERLSRQQPHLLERIVFCSGGPTTQRCEQFLNEPGVVFVPKPIGHDALNQWLTRTERRRSTIRPSPSS
jgi:two-component system NtrC family sensor kinase